MPATRQTSPTGRADLDSVIGPTAWATNQLTFGFTSSSADYPAGYGSGEAANVRALSPEGQAAFRDAIREWAQVAQINVTEVPGASADLRIAVNPPTSTAFAYYPSAAGEGGDVWVGSYVVDRGFARGGYSYLTAIHEVGHALGLEHPHEQPNPGAADQMASSVMSYRSYPGAPLTGYSNGASSYASSPMLFDILAVQTLYGANYAARAGDTLYRWTPGTLDAAIADSAGGSSGATARADARVFETVWDGGGTDTYDFSAYATPLRVDLSPGGWTYLGQQLADLGQGRTPPGNIANAFLFNGDTRSLIENAVGGSGADEMRGNVANNRLEGGVGNDTLFGAAGSDVVVGGEGNDLLFGGSQVADPNDAADVVVGGAGADTIYGNGGNDTLEAGAGADLVYGGFGADLIRDTMDGGRVAIFGGGSSFDPNEQGDRIEVVGNLNGGEIHVFGNGGNDQIDLRVAGGGRIEAYGGVGDNAILIQAADPNAVAYVVAGTGADRVDIAVGGVATVVGGANAGNPMDGADTIDGTSSTGRLLIEGGLGNDRLIGGSNNDTIVGGSGADTLTGNGGADVFVFASGETLASSGDVITDFGAGDRISFGGASGSAGNFTVLSAGSRDAAAAASGVATTYAAVVSEAGTVVFADLDGDGIRESSVTLLGFTGGASFAMIA